MEREGGRGENGGVAPKKGEGKEEVITHLRASASNRSGRGGGGGGGRVEKTHLLEKFSPSWAHDGALHNYALLLLSHCSLWRRRESTALPKGGKGG